MNISGLKAQQISDMPHGSKDNESITERMAVTRLDYISDLENELDSKMRLLMAIDSVILYLNPVEKEIIRLRYLEIPIGKPKANWSQIAQALNYSEDYCKEVDCRIIREIQEKLLKYPTKHPHFMQKNVI